MVRSAPRPGEKQHNDEQKIKKTILQPHRQKTKKLNRCPPEPIPMTYPEGQG